MEESRKVLKVQVVKDDQPSKFERRSIIVAWLGVFVSFLSLVAACIAAIVVYGQLNQMKNQTKILNAGATQAGIDSKAAGEATARQLALMQAQLLQSEYAGRLDERASIEIEPIKPVLHDVRPDLELSEYQYDFYFKNVGKTAARDIVVGATNGTNNIQSIGNTKNVESIHNIQDKFLTGKVKSFPMIRRGGPVPSVLGPNVVSPVPVTFFARTPQIFPNSMGVEMLVGRVDYKDEFKVEHWLRFCFYVADANGKLETCDAGNDEDHNPEMVTMPMARGSK